MSKKYVKKPVIIEALLWTGKNLNEMIHFIGKHLDFKYEYDVRRLYIKTLKGELHVSVGDYIIKDANGAFYPCKPDIFKQTYEEISKDE